MNVAVLPGKFPARATRRAQAVAGPSRRPLGQILLEMGAVAPGDLLKAIAMREREDARLGDILLTHGWITEADLMAALSLQWRARVVDPLADAPDPRLVDALGPEFCLTHGILPWRRAGRCHRHRHVAPRPVPRPARHVAAGIRTLWHGACVGTRHSRGPAGDPPDRPDPQRRNPRGLHRKLPGHLRADQFALCHGGACGGGACLRAGADRDLRGRCSAGRC